MVDPRKNGLRLLADELQQLVDELVGEEGEDSLSGAVSGTLATSEGTAFAQETIRAASIDPSVPAKTVCRAARKSTASRRVGSTVRERLASQAAEIIA